MGRGSKAQNEFVDMDYNMATHIGTLSRAVCRKIFSYEHNGHPQTADHSRMLLFRSDWSIFLGMWLRGHWQDVRPERRPSTLSAFTTGTDTWREQLTERGWASPLTALEGFSSWLLSGYKKVAHCRGHKQESVTAQFTRKWESGGGKVWQTPLW